jgi:hypothetical protein
MDDREQAGLAAPQRVNYVYGMLLGVDDFEAEQRYGIGLRRLGNRLVHGHGVVCGLGVEVAEGGDGVRVLPGLAFDGWGREIVVPEPSAWLSPAPGPGAHALVSVAYEETLDDPAPVVGDGDGDGEALSLPTRIGERYRVGLAPAGRARHRPAPGGGIVADGRIDADALARWVTERPACDRPPDDPSVPLARVRVADPDTAPRFDPADVDITVRPVVLSNAVLLQVIRELTSRRRSG